MTHAALESVEDVAEVPRWVSTLIGASALAVAPRVVPSPTPNRRGGVVLTIIESESSVWMVISVDGQLRLYSRAEEGEWGELSLSEDPEQVDPEKSFMLEELFARENGDEEDDEGEPDGEEEESDDDGPELERADEPEDGEDEAPEEEEKPRRRRAAAPKNGRSTSARR